MLNEGEANLPRKCVVNVAQIKSVDRPSIKEKMRSMWWRTKDEHFRLTFSSKSIIEIQ